jgi:hypothetical protein
MEPASFKPEQGNMDTENILLQMFQRSSKVYELSNRELAQVMVDLTGEHPVNSYFFILCMEVAERLCPEIFDEADSDPNSPLYGKRQKMDRWETVPNSLRYDLITYAMNHGEFPRGYRIQRFVSGNEEKEKETVDGQSVEEGSKGDEGGSSH